METHLNILNLTSYLKVVLNLTRGCKNYVTRNITYSLFRCAIVNIMPHFMICCVCMHMNKFGECE